MNETEEKVNQEKECHNHDCKCHKEGEHQEHHSHCKCEKHGSHDKKDHKLKEKVEKLEQEKEELLEKVKYHQAELINYRKRKEEETMNRLKYANQDLILEIIPVLDNFERAIKLDDNDLSDELSKFLDGFKMMYVHLADVLKQFGVEEIEAADKDFDPNCMEAMMIDDVQEKEDNLVLEVLLKGYRLKDRVIRPAAVKVNKKNDKGEENNE